MGVGIGSRVRMAIAVIATLVRFGAWSGCAPGQASDTSIAPQEEPPGLEHDQVAERARATGVDSAGLIARASLSNEVIVGLLRDFEYRGEGFLLVNDQPFPSTVSPGKSVTLWISEASYDAFTEVSPDARGSNAELPVGTVIVREVLNRDELETITVMVKLPEGTFPLGGDFWYAATDPDGTIRTDKAEGIPQAGLLENCGTCHLRRSDDAFVFGAPAPR